MNEEIELQAIVQSFIEKSLDIFKRFEHQPEKLFKYLEQWFNLSSDYLAWLGVFTNDPQLTQQTLFSYWQDAMGLLQEQLNNCLEGKIMPIGDKRFSADELVNYPFFNLLIQHYLLAREQPICRLKCTLNIYAGCIYIMI